MTYPNSSFRLSKTLHDDVHDILFDIPFIKKGKNCLISNVPAVFDIETSSFYSGDQKQCTMYAFVFGINGRCARGRTWNDFMHIIDIIVKTYELSEKKHFVIYVHNLSFEFQWIQHLFEWEKVFSIDSRKPIYAITKNGIEFRCSYLLTGYSLEVLGKNLLKYKVNKKVGDIDYKLIRHSATPLTDKEWDYILYDGLVVMAHIQEEIERLGSLKEIPLTKTGYVRKLITDNCVKGDSRWEYIKMMKTLTLDDKEYAQVKRAYAGGFTHANVHYVNRVIKDVYSYDFTSSYPAVMISEKYPMSAPFRVSLKNGKDFMRHLKAYNCMFDVKFFNITAKVSYENYISFSRCFDINHYVLNNGRVIEATELSMTLTEQDFFIIMRLYKWDGMEISNMRCFYSDYLPKEIILSILELYKKKTELKGVPGEEAEYMVAKNMINSVYGMCVTDICRDEIIYNKGWQENKKPNITEQLSKYNKNPQRALYYPWGVWVTAYARANLFSGICEFGDDYIYSDTDSIKVRNIDKHAKYIDDYNKKIKKKINDCLAHYNIEKTMATPKTIKGVEKPLGVWDYEGKYDRFKTLGAKRYITEKDGDISITIAGVSKEAGKEYLLRTRKNNTEIFRDFQEDLTFPARYIYKEEEYNGSGKMLHTYIDIPMKGTVIDYMGNKAEYNELSGMHLENTEYTMGLDKDFAKLIMGYKESHII